MSRPALLPRQASGPCNQRRGQKQRATSAIQPLRCNRVPEAAAVATRVRAKPFVFRRHVTPLPFPNRFCDVSVRTKRIKAGRGMGPILSLRANFATVTNRTGEGPRRVDPRTRCQGLAVRGRGRIEKTRAASGDGAGLVSLWRLHIPGEAMRKRRNAAVCVGRGRVGPGCSRIGWGCPAQPKGARKLAALIADHGRPFMAGKSRNWPRPALSRALQKGDAHPEP